MLLTLNGSMTISVCRDGVLIGEWTEEAVRTFYQESRLVDSDSYWMPGMSIWKPLAELMRPAGPPPIPRPKIVASLISVPAPLVPVSLPKTRSSINRLWFVIGLVLSFSGACLMGLIGIYAGVPSDDLGKIVMLPLFGAVGALVVCRLYNAGHSRRFALLLFFPVLNLILVGFCCFAPPATQKS